MFFFYVYFKLVVFVFNFDVSMIVAVVKKRLSKKKYEDIFICLKL